MKGFKLMSNKKDTTNKYLSFLNAALIASLALLIICFVVIGVISPKADNATAAPKITDIQKAHKSDFQVDSTLVTQYQHAKTPVKKVAVLNKAFTLNDYGSLKQIKQKWPAALTSLVLNAALYRHYQQAPSNKTNQAKMKVLCQDQKHNLSNFSLKNKTNHIRYQKLNLAIKQTFADMTTD